MSYHKAITVYFFYFVRNYFSMAILGESFNTHNTTELFNYHVFIQGFNNTCSFI